MKKTNFCNSQGNGFEAGLELKCPYVEIEVEAIACMNPTSLTVELGEDLTLRAAPNGDACDTGDSYQEALKLSPQAGIEASFTAGKIKGGKDVDITLGVSNFSLITRDTRPYLLTES